MVKAASQRQIKDELLILLRDSDFQTQLRQILDGDRPDDLASTPAAPPDPNTLQTSQLLKLLFEAIQQQTSAIQQQTRTYAQIGRTAQAIQRTARAGREWRNLAGEVMDVGRMVMLGSAGILFVLFILVLTAISLKNAIVKAVGDRLGSPPSQPTPFTAVTDIPPLLAGGNIAGVAITSGFGPRVHPITQRDRPHNGVDLALPVGTPLYAIADTEVDCREEPNGFGTYARYDTADGKTVILAHLTPGSCLPGTIGAGELVARSGGSGLSTAPHLHLQLEDQGTAKPPTVDVALSTLTPVSRERLNTMVAALYPAIVAQESGGDPTASNHASGAEAIGSTQVMTYNIKPWSRQALGREISIGDFRESPSLQQQISLYELYQICAQQLPLAGLNSDLAMRRVAAVWYSGKAERYQDYSPIPGQPQSPSVGNYVEQVMERLRQ
jgi:murein DD-endopeptidase MepM/ murein hydrolase activator NlpD